MATPQEILQQMITASPTQATTIQQSIDQVQATIDIYQAKQDAMKTEVGDVAILRLETYLFQTKFVPGADYYQYKGANYNQILIANGTLTDWSIYKILTLTNLSYVNASTFECSGNETAIFLEGANLSILLGTTRIYDTVSSAVYENNKTTVVLNSSFLDVTLESIWLLHYVYSPGDDTTVDDYKSQWDFAHDYIVQILGTTGTYGTQDNIVKLNTAKTLLQNNKDKIVNSVAIFQNFV